MLLQHPPAAAAVAAVAAADNQLQRKFLRWVGVHPTLAPWESMQSSCMENVRTSSVSSCLPREFKLCDWGWCRAQQQLLRFSPKSKRTCLLDTGLNSNFSFLSVTHHQDANYLRTYDTSPDFEVGRPRNQFPAKSIPNKPNSVLSKLMTIEDDDTAELKTVFLGKKNHNIPSKRFGKIEIDCYSHWTHSKRGL